MFGRRKEQTTQSVATLPPELPKHWRRPPVEFPSEVITPLRYMTAQLGSRALLPKSISVVSALREEGVTFTALALGLTMATDLNESVCVIELNWWWPGLAAMLSLTTKQGLAGLLVKSSPLVNVLVPTKQRNLFLLPAGDLSENMRAPLVRGPRLRALLSELSEQFDRLILDVPAIRGTSEAIPLALLADASLLVIRQGVTPIGTVRSDLDEIRHLGVLGGILNRARVSTPNWLSQLIPPE